MSVLEEPKTIVDEADILILGGGIAACHAAIRAKDSGLDVLLIDKGSIGRSGFSPMLSGVLTYFDPEKDDHDEWYRECIEAGQGLVDQGRLQGMIYHTHERIKDMGSWGVKFQKEGGEYLRKPCVGHIHTRNIFMVNSGLQLMSVLRGEVIRRGIRVINRVMATDLLTSDGVAVTKGRVVGAVGFNVRTGHFHVVKAKATVIATGSTNSIHVGTSFGVLSGDGQAMALRAGCEIRNLEIGAYGPIPAGINCAPGLNIFGAEGACFVNANGEKFMAKWDKVRADRAPRAVVARAIATEEFEGRGPVYLDARHLESSAYKRIEMCAPIVLASFNAMGLDIRKDRIPYTVSTRDLGAGGINVDSEYRTSIRGLYAAGAVSDHAEDGVSNVVSQGMASLIEGYLAGESAAKYAAEAETPMIQDHQVKAFKERIFSPLKCEADLRHPEVREHCKNIIKEGLVGPLKNSRGLNEAIEIARQIRAEEIPRLAAKDYHELARAIGLKNEMYYLELYPRCSLFRTESRGSHIREDYPEKDDKNWLKWVLAKLEDDGIKVWAEPVPQ
jgi:succinate dehydrogenase/fumarate reductase flavoprotein subunit